MPPPTALYPLDGIGSRGIEGQEMEDDTLVPVEGTAEDVETQVRQRILLGGPTYICIG